MTQYYIVTELERKTPGYDTLEEAIEAAEQSIPESMNWEIREEDDGLEDVVYTHYTEENKLWYAVVQHDNYPDWGTGSYDKDEAIQMARDRGPDYYIAVIDESGREPMCVDEIEVDDE